MFEATEAMKATLTDSSGRKVEYMPAAIMMFEGQQYLVMRAQGGELVQDEILLLWIDQSENGTQLRLVEDQRPFVKAIEDTLGLQRMVH